MKSVVSNQCLYGLSGIHIRFVNGFKFIVILGIIIRLFLIKLLIFYDDLYQLSRLIMDLSYYYMFVIFSHLQLIIYFSLNFNL